MFKDKTRKGPRKNSDLEKEESAKKREKYGTFEKSVVMFRYEKV